MKQQPIDEAALSAWLRQELDRAGIHWSDHELSYDANSPYDLFCYRLLEQAERVWRSRSGQAPTPGQLQRALRNAEFDRARQKRLAPLRPWWKKLFFS